MAKACLAIILNTFEKWKEEDSSVRSFSSKNSEKEGQNFLMKWK